MAKELKIKIGVEVDQSKARGELDKVLNDMQKKKVKIGFDVDTKALNSLKKTLEGFKNIKIGINTDTKGATTSVKSITNTVKQTNSELNQQKQIYSELKRLQNEEYSIKQKMIGANGQYKTTLESQLSSIKQQQEATRGLLTEGGKNLVNKEKEMQLTQQIAKKENELTQARTKANADMERAINNAKNNINIKGLDTKSIEEYKKRLDEIDKTNMTHVKEQIASIGREIDAQRNKIQETVKSLESYSAAFNGIGDALIGVFSIPTAGLAASVKTMSDFSFEMSKVEAISGASGQALVDLENKAKELGRETMWSAKESAEALKYMGMAGWDSTAMLEGLPHMLNLASAGGLALGTASDIVTDALTAFKLEASSTAEFVDVLAVASSKSNTNVQMLGE